jgi:hypothetical protein
VTRFLNILLALCGAPAIPPAPSSPRGGQPAPNAATLIQASTKNRRVMGYASLVLYRSLWNDPRGEITLIPLHARP